ncbi:MAG: hypothetical protein QOF87_4017, partial [Pseudonocardiales bacterium]|nr:hypothetical protein [Pseudonocardiales bacterium]
DAAAAGLRRVGFSWTEIASRLGITRQAGPAGCVEAIGLRLLVNGGVSLERLITPR